MGQDNALIFAFNRGLISRLALARIDLDRLPLSAEVMTNWIPRVLGSMTIRPGLGHLAITNSDNQARFHPFVFSASELALLEFTNTTFRVWKDDTPLTRASVSTSITNGTFDSNITGWTDNSDTNGQIQWVTGGYMGILGDGSDRGIAEQQVTVAGGDQGTQHALRIIVERGPITLRVGTATGLDDVVPETVLKTGHHSITFTPVGNVFVQFQSYFIWEALLDSVAIEASGIFTMTSPYATADLEFIRSTQSGDVVFLACEDIKPRMIERRDNDSWSLVEYTPEDGPFLPINITPITITPSATTGDITLTASNPLFSSNHVGALFRLTAFSQQRSASITAQNTFTDSIEVTGVGEEREFHISLTGTWTATVTLQRSFDEGTTWIDVTTWTANVETTHDDGLDNQIILYRVGVKTGDFTSGTVVVEVNYSQGAQTGIVEITSFSSSTSVGARVFAQLGSTDATDNWYEGIWSTFRGFPTAVELHQGRLWWAGRDRIIGSVSDEYQSHDDNVIGDSGPISRTIGIGPIREIHWMKGVNNRLLFGTKLSQFEARSNQFDEPLTPSNFNINESGTEGTHKIDSVKVDKAVHFIDKAKVRLFNMLYNPDQGLHDSVDMGVHTPDVTKPEIIKIGVQRQPDIRLHCIRSDGKVALLVYNRAEDIVCWCLVQTDGTIEDVVILPGDIEDAVYYVVQRTINGSTKRFFEKWAIEDETRHGNTKKCFTTAQTLIEDLPYLDGTLLVSYDDDLNIIEFLTVTNSSVTLSQARTCINLVPAIHPIADSYVTFDRDAATYVPPVISSGFTTYNAFTSNTHTASYFDIDNLKLWLIRSNGVGNTIEYELIDLATLTADITGNFSAFNDQGILPSSVDMTADGTIYIAHRNSNNATGKRISSVTTAGVETDHVVENAPGSTNPGSFLLAVGEITDENDAEIVVGLLTHEGDTAFSDTDIWDITNDTDLGALSWTGNDTSPKEEGNNPVSVIAGNRDGKTRDFYAFTFSRDTGDGTYLGLNMYKVEVSYSTGSAVVTQSLLFTIDLGSELTTSLAAFDFTGTDFTDFMIGSGFMMFDEVEEEFVIHIHVGNLADDMNSILFRCDLTGTILWENTIDQGAASEAVGFPCNIVTAPHSYKKAISGNIIHVCFEDLISRISLLTGHFDTTGLEDWSGAAALGSGLTHGNYYDPVNGDVYLIDVSSTVDILTNTPTFPIDVLSHLEGETVVGRGDGRDLGTFTVVSGTVSPGYVHKAIFGLAYNAKWKSTKLAYAAAFGTAFSQIGSVHQLSLMMADVHQRGIRFGPDFDNLDWLPKVQEGEVTDDDFIWIEFDKDMSNFIKRHTADPRICLQGGAPNPVTIMAAIIGIKRKETR